MIRINVALKVSPDKRAEALETALRLAEASAREPGCLGYEVYEKAACPERLMILETWESGEALARHERTPHFTALVPRLRNKLTLEMKAERFAF